MQVDVKTEIVVERPCEEVAAYAGNPDNAQEWYANIHSVEWHTQPPVQVGSQIAFVARFLGRTLSYIYEVVELEPGRRMVMRTSSGPFAMETTYAWEPVDEHRTRMVLRNRGTPTGFSKLVAPFMQRAMRGANEKDLALLKTILEHKPSPA